MPNLIQIKYSVATAAPPTLAQGELAFSESSDTLFVGNSLGAVVPIGGEGFLAGSTSIVTSVNGQTGDVALAVADIPGAAPIDAPIFTGIPAADTAAPGTSTTQLATTEFVMGQGFTTAATAPVTSVATKTGAVALVVGDVTGAAPLLSPVFLGTPTAPTPPIADDSLAIATTAWVLDQGYVTAASSGLVESVNGKTGVVVLVVADIPDAAPIASPIFTGIPAADTAAPGTSTTQLATTEFVMGQGFTTAATAPVTSVATKTGAVALVVGDVTGAAPLTSPTFLGIPAAPTAAVGTSTTQLATTEFVMGQGFAAGIVTTAGTFTKVTINAQGLVTAGSSLIAADIPKTLDHTWITDFDVQVRTSRLDQMAVPTAAVLMNDQLISGLATPLVASDAATKGYVDGVAQGLDIKNSCECASTGDLTLTGLQDVDGHTTVAGDRVLVKNQTDPTQNGIYEAKVAAWTRAPDFDGAFVTSGAYTFIANGTVNGASGWVLTTPDPITVGTTDLIFAQFSGAGSYQASGNGIILTGNTFDLVGVTGEVTTTAGGIGIDAAYTAAIQAKIDLPTNTTLNGGTF